MLYRLLNFFKRNREIQILSQEDFQFQHAFEIKTMYRRYLKILPTLFDRHLIIQAKLKEVQWIFREAKDESCPETVKYYKDMGYYVLKQINEKKYPPFPQIYPNPLKNQGLRAHPFNRKLITHYKII